MIFTQFQKIMNNVDAEIKVAISKIARALEGISLDVALIALETMLIASVLHSTDPKEIADTIIIDIKKAVENAEGGEKW